MGGDIGRLIGDILLGDICDESYRMPMGDICRLGDNDGLAGDIGRPKAAIDRLGDDAGRLGGDISLLNGENGRLGGVAWRLSSDGDQYLIGDTDRL